MPAPTPTMNQSVFRAILAMDSYNRGYGANVTYSQVSGRIGTATFVTDSTVQIGLPITSAAGFYASAYNWNGQSVISYRGTNPVFGSSVSDVLSSPIFRDIWNGWTIALGYSGASQAQLALSFYEAVAGVSSPYYLIDNPTNSTILLGHSLGGGLAGFVGALSGEVSYGYDHMPFGLAVYAQATSDSVTAATLATGITLN